MAGGGVAERLAEAGFTPEQIAGALALNGALSTYSLEEVGQRLEYLDYIQAAGCFGAGETIQDFASRQPWVLQQKMEEVYVDGEFVIVNKPFDLRIDVPRSGEKKWPGETTVASWVAARHVEVVESSPKFCNQIDYGTSGIIVLAKDKKSAKVCTALFSERETRKAYLAVVFGHPKWDELEVEQPVGNHPAEGFKMAVVPEAEGGKASLTRFEVLERGYLALGGPHEGAAVTKVLARPHTGRRHQIRVHLQHAGYPIVGDMQYSHDRDSFRMFLHAWKLVLPFKLPRRELSLETADPFVGIVTPGGRQSAREGAGGAEGAEGEGEAGEDGPHAKRRHVAPP